MRKGLHQVIENTRYKVIPRVLIFIFNDFDQVLLIKGSQTKGIWANQYNGLGGHVESGESILEAANRELAEESGISNCDLVFVGNIMIDPSAELGVSMFLFCGRSNTKGFLHTDEGDLQWINIADIDQITCVADLPILIPSVLNSMQEKKLIFGKYLYDQNKEMRIVL